MPAWLPVFEFHFSVVLVLLPRVGERRHDSRRLDVPGSRGGGVRHCLLTPGRRRGEGPAPELPRVGGGVVERRRGREDLPGRVVGRVVDDPVADEQRSALGVDVAHGTELLGNVHQEHLVGPPNAVRGCRHRDEACSRRLGVALDVHHGPAVLGSGVRDRARRLSCSLCGGAHGVVCGECDGARELCLRRQRGRQERDLAVDHADRDETVATSVEPAERLAEEDSAARAELRRVDELERGELALRETEQLPACAQVRTRGRDVVGWKPRGEVRTRVGERLGRPELVEAGFVAGLDLAALPVGRSLAALPVVDVRVGSCLTLDVGRSGCARSRCGRRHGRRHEHEDGETGGRKQRAAAGPARRHVHGDPPSWVCSSPFALSANRVSTRGSGGSSHAAGIVESGRP